jgi:hypothetical protein
MLQGDQLCESFLARLLRWLLLGQVALLIEKYREYPRRHNFSNPLWKINVVLMVTRYYNR